MNLHGADAAAAIKRPTHRLRRRSAVFVTVCAIGVSLFMATFGLLQRGNFWFSDMLYAETPLSGKVMIVAIDDATLNEYGRSLTSWSRGLYGQLVRVVSEAGARVIAFDILFSQPAPGDDEFRAAIEAARNGPNRTRIVLGAADPENAVGPVVMPIQALAEVADYVGHVNVTLDGDSAIRRLEIFAEASGGELPALSTAAYLSYLRIPATALDQVKSGPADGRLILAGKAIPVDGDNLTLINYAGSTDAVPVVSLHDVLKGAVAPEFFAGRVVLVGTKNAAGYPDRYFVPLSRRGEPMAGVEIHANVVDMLIQGRFLTGSPFWVTVLTVIGVTLLGVWAFSVGTWQFALLVLISILGGGVLIASAAFTLAGVALNLFYPLVALGIAFVGISGLRMISEIRLRVAFGRFVNTVAMLITEDQNPDEVLKRAGQALEQNLGYKTVYIWRTGQQDIPLDLRYQTAGSQPPAELSQNMAASAVQAHRMAFKGNGVAIPLRSQKQVYGVLVAEAHQKPSDEQNTILSVFAERLTPTYANALLYAAMKDLEMLKTQMLRMASHDLRNPLMLINGYLDILELSANEDQYASIGIIRDAANRMLRIIRDVLDMELVRSGKVELKPLALDSLVAEVAMEFEVQAAQAKQRLVVSLPPDEITVLGSQSQLREAIGNLLSNAIKYTPADGTITFALQQVPAQHKAVISVSDTGFGIPLEEQPNLFKPFHRVYMEETRDIPGTGLGLSLVKAVIDQHKGRISVQSAPGVGSTFTVELPVVPSGGAPTPTAQSH